MRFLITYSSEITFRPKYSSKCSSKIFDEYFGSLVDMFSVAEAVMRKRSELEKMKMLRQDEERRREELVGEQPKNNKKLKVEKKIEIIN